MHLFPLKGRTDILFSVFLASYAFFPFHFWFLPLNSYAARTLTDLFCFPLCRLMCLWLITYVTYVFYFFGFFSSHWRSLYDQTRARFPVVLFYTMRIDLGRRKHTNRERERVSRGWLFHLFVCLLCARHSRKEENDVVVILFYNIHKTRLLEYVE